MAPIIKQARKAKKHAGWLGGRRAAVGECAGPWSLQPYGQHASCWGGEGAGREQERFWIQPGVAEVGSVLRAHASRGRLFLQASMLMSWQRDNPGGSTGGITRVENLKEEAS